MRAFAAKLIICLAGFALLYSVGKSVAALWILLATSLLSFAAGSVLRSAKKSYLHELVQRLAVPSAFALIVALNLTGLIGTLTGSQAKSSDSATALFIAIPFYLLSAAAFVADMAKQNHKLPKLINYLVYVTMPFKLLAGPLEPPKLLLQIEQMTGRIRQIHCLLAWPWIVMGAFMKFVIANRLEPARHLSQTDPITSILSAAVFELKFYFDFAGYSFMAYGAALALGLRINQNFKHPFLAKNVILFWRQWHISLGQFLSRYVMEPNLHIWQNREQKLVFVSSIFLVSAMWHGGTFNYLLWGIFHASCYFSYTRWLKRRNNSWLVGLAAMLVFFVLGRMLAIDADAGRLLTRLTHLVDPLAYLDAWRTLNLAGLLMEQEIKALALAFIFITAEWFSSRYCERRQGYHLFRRPLTSIAMLLIFLLFGIDGGAPLYARL